MSKYTLRSESNFEDDGYEETRIYQFENHGTLQNLCYKLYCWLQMEGYTYVSGITIHTDGGNDITSEL